MHTVQFSYRIYVSRSLIIKIMTAALTRSSYVEAMQRRARTFSTGGDQNQEDHISRRPLKSS